MVIFVFPATDWFVDDRPRNLVDKLVRWTCRDECSYECMWQAKDAFLDRGWRTPQFFGKVKYLSPSGCPYNSFLLPVALCSLVGNAGAGIDDFLPSEPAG